MNDEDEFGDARGGGSDHDNDDGNFDHLDPDKKLSKKEMAKLEKKQRKEQARQAQRQM